MEGLAGCYREAFAYRDDAACVDAAGFYLPLASPLPGQLGYRAPLPYRGPCTPFPTGAPIPTPLPGAR